MTNFILLAAGRGSRLGDLTKDLPKCLGVYRGRPLVESILENIYSLPFPTKNVFIVGGYKCDELEYLGIPIIKNINWETSGPFQSLVCASDLLETAESVITYTDIYYSNRFLEESCSFEADIYVPSNKNFLQSWNNRNISPLDDLETFKYENDLLLEIGNKPSNISEIQGQYAGILKITPEGWKKLRRVQSVATSSIYDITSLLNVSLNQGIEIKTTQVEGFWKEFDLPDDFKID